jgi:hypothetical protein
MDTLKLQQQIDNLQKQLDALKSSTTLPREVGEAIRVRLQPVSGDTNNTSTAAYLQAVNEAGVQTYSVAKPMTGFITITIGGNARLIPYY